VVKRFVEPKRIIAPTDARLKVVREKNRKKAATDALAPRSVPQVPSALFFTHNTALGPPYQILLDTNFINFR